MKCEKNIYDMICDLYEANCRRTDHVEYIQNQNYATISIFKMPSIQIKISNGRGRSYLAFKSSMMDKIDHELYLESSSSTGDWPKLYIDNTFDPQQISSTLLAIFDYRESITGSDKFGCCHRYILCSDNLSCVHPDAIFAKKCMYKVNLDAGRIFYGKNRNVFKDENGVDY